MVCDKIYLIKSGGGLMKKILTVIGIAFHAITYVLFVLYDKVPDFDTALNILVILILTLILSFIAYYAEATWAFNNCTNVFNVIKLIYVLISVLLPIVFLAVLCTDKDGLEVLYRFFAVYHLLLFILEVVSLFRKNGDVKEE